MTTKFDTVDEYIASFPTEVQPKLQAIRDAIHRAAPDVAESISYAIPTFATSMGKLVHFGGWKHHIGMYPVPDDDALEPELARFRSTKDTLRFSLAEPIPVELIERTVAMLAGRQAAASTPSI
ncbi:MAG: hypothetical protein JWN99_3399 [Ilumatobacteraceae bacterium]|nr:hypothetical protein [Ilumatobacteraceae bacterium]